MSLASWTPCDEIGMDGHHHCPYCEDGEYVNCDWYCGYEEPQDDPYDYEEEEYENYNDYGDDSFYSDLGFDKWEDG